MKRAYSVNNVMAATFKTIPLEGAWLESLGLPEFGGSWVVYGMPKNGKTSLSMMLAKELCKYGKVAYDSVEEGLSLSVREALVRVGMDEVSRRFVLLDKETVGELVERLEKRSSPDVVVIDSVQFLGLTWKEYKMLKERFPRKLFIYVSHVEGMKPEGKVAQQIWRDANVYIRVEGFRGFPVGRYGGGAPIDIDKERAAAYWEMQK